MRTSLTTMRLWTLEGNDLATSDPESAQRMAETYPHLTAQEVIACAERLLDLFERIAPDYCARTGIAYPAHKAATMRALLAEFRALDGNH